MTPGTLFGVILGSILVAVVVIAVGWWWISGIVEKNNKQKAFEEDMRKFRQEVIRQQG